MTDAERRELAELLARLIIDGEITEEQAAAIYLAAIDGDLSEFLPLPPYLGIGEAEQPDEEEIAILLAAIAGAAALAPHAAERRRIAGADRLQDWHTAQAGQLADDLAAGRLSVAEFQRRMIDLNNRHNAAQIDLGSAGRRYRMARQAGEIARVQAAYLQRFADQIAGRYMEQAAVESGHATAGRPPYSADYLAERAAQYGGIGRALFFEANEAAAAAGQGAPGFVIRYIARDDANTCSPCHRAQGYYLPGRGPYPGDICLGRHHCRCRRVSVYDPAIYARLIGAAVIA